MITNIENITGYNGRTSFPPEDGRYFDVGSFDDGDFDALSISTLGSNLSVPSLRKEDHISLPTTPKGLLPTSSRDNLKQPTIENSLNNEKQPGVVKSPFLNTKLPIPRFNYDDEVKSPFLSTKLPIPRFNYDDVSVPSKDENNPNGSLSNDLNSHSDGDCPLLRANNKPLSRSSRKRKQRDLPLHRSLRKRKQTLSSDSSSDSEETRSSSDSSLSLSDHKRPCGSERGKRACIDYSYGTSRDTFEEDSSLPPDEYEIQEILRRRIKGGIYEYLIEWKPTWEPEEVETMFVEGNGAWKLEKVLGRRLNGGDIEIKCQWAASWEPEDSLGDEALRCAQKRFRDANDNEKENNNKSDDDDETLGEKLAFDGEKMVAVRNGEGPKTVLRRIVKQRMNECRHHDSSNDAAK